MESDPESNYNFLKFSKSRSQGCSQSWLTRDQDKLLSVDILLKDKSNKYISMTARRDWLWSVAARAGNLSLSQVSTDNTHSNLGQLQGFSVEGFNSDIDNFYEHWIHNNQRRRLLATNCFNPGQASTFYKEEALEGALISKHPSQYWCQNWGTLVSDCHTLCSLLSVFNYCDVTR